MFWNNPTVLEDFSSRGPSQDGRVKPDLVAPDGVSTATYGASNGVAYPSGTGFFGTSASAPHAAGAAALVKERHPSYTPAQIQAYLEERAIDLGAAGKDNLYGSGRLSLGALPPPPPALSSPANGATVSGTSITFQWNASAGATKYWLEIYGGGGYFYDANVGNVTSKEVTGFPNDGTIYYWRVFAGNDAGWNPSSRRSFTNVGLPPPPALSSPANGTTVSGTSITFQWNASTGATRYWLEIYGGGRYFYDANVGNVTSKQVNGFPSDGTTYRWRVLPGNAAGWNSNCPRWSFTNVRPLPPPVLSSPANGATVPGTSITFQWNASAGATKYWLEIYGGGGYFYDANVGDVTSKEVTGFPNDGTTYRWRVLPGNAAGWNINSPRWSFTNGPP